MNRQYVAAPLNLAVNPDYIELVSHFQHLAAVYHANDIHEIKYLDRSFEAVDEFCAYQAFLNVYLPPGYVIRQLFDLRGEIPTIPYYIQKMQQLTRQYPLRQRHRIAAVYASEHSVHLQIAGRLLTILPLNWLHVRYRYFPAAHYEDAREWLLKDDRRH